MELNSKDFQVVDGKVILNDPDLARIVSEESYDVDSNTGSNGISITITKM